ncbi:hypothetical protein BGZ70_010474 [Mortierella alpina]|uniref:Endonuclease/exonuclease/phosphatase domain-containing protein n=1 Tax=Mortierella alpina TaxID=64518 RepID=A0A9P6JCF1_MORAP|nr:hypothetical protein BGZ70_010474 [Mortierella alpina]
MLTLPSAEGLAQDAGGIRMRKKKDRFLFMTYNLLAQALVRRDMFPHASQKALRWKFRKQNLLQEFLAYAPDLACLQEVDFWEEVYLPALTKAGYETSYYKNEKKKHGCAIIWRKTRFEKMDQMTLEYDDIGQPTFTTGNIGLMVALQPLQQKASENPDPNADMVLPEEDEGKDDEKEAAQDYEALVPGGILVATTHLFWRPDGSYERLRQASILLQKIDEWNKHLNFTVLLGGAEKASPETTIADSTKFGDSEDPKIKNLAAMASSASGEDAPVHAPLEVFTPAKDLLAAVEAYARCISIYGQYETLTKDHPAEVNTKVVEASDEIESTATAAPVEHTHGEPTFTNFATWFKDTLDYVYLYDQPIPEAGARLVPLRLLEIPDKSFLGHGLPDENFSSDHLCLMVEFALLAR